MDEDDGMGNLGQGVMWATLSFRGNIGFDYSFRDSI